jgi:hypothetical protein
LGHKLSINSLNRKVKRHYSVIGTNNKNNQFEQDPITVNFANIHSPDFILRRKNLSKQSSVRVSMEKAQQLILKNINSMVLENAYEIEKQSNEFFNETTNESSAVVFS